MDPRKTFTMFLHSARLTNTPILSSKLSLGTPMQVVAVTDFLSPSIKIKKRVVRSAGAELRASNDRHIRSVLLVADFGTDMITQFEPIHVDAISGIWQAKFISKGESA